MENYIDKTEQNVSRETSSNKVARKPKDAFCMVNEKYRNILSKQVQKENIDVKKWSLKRL